MDLVGLMWGRTSAWAFNVCQLVRASTEFVIECVWVCSGVVESMYRWLVAGVVMSLA